ncbi:MAG: membrane-bound lytic murein transglycosylase D [Flavobacteriales bacterium]|jgi:membrane-bound lytic murein transglycosylase D
MRQLLIFILFAISTSLSAQSVKDLDFLKHSTDESVDQWLCTSFEKAHPKYFAQEQCPPKFQSADPSSITSDFNLVLPAPLVYSDYLADLWLNADCDKFIHIKALSDLYFPLFEQKLKSLGLHEDYKYLPVVLSGLNAGYVNKTRSGLWQLEFVTARKYKQRVDEIIDERNAADLSTDAALVQLSVLEKKYAGDKQKILLAFMTSISRVEKYNREATAAGVSFYEVLDDASKARLETFYTSSRLFKSLQTDNALFDYIALLNQYQNYVFTNDVSMDALVHFCKSSRQELEGMNEVYKGTTVPGMYRGVPFILKQEDALVVEALGDSLYSWERHRAEELAAAKEKEVKQISSGIPAAGTFDEINYTVRQGDVLGVIATKFAVRVSDIRSWNNLRGDMIYVGQDLTIYGKKGKSAAAKKEVTEAPEKPKKTVPSTSNFETYRVKSGESLWLIARKFAGISAEDIMRWNDIDANIRPGQELKIYPAGS